MVFLFDYMQRGIAGATFYHHKLKKKKEKTTLKTDTINNLLKKGAGDTQLLTTAMRVMPCPNLIPSHTLHTQPYWLQQ